MEFIESIKISERWQVVLPRVLRDKMELQKGDFLLFFNDKSKIIVRVGTKQDLKNLYEKKYKED